MKKNATVVLCATLCLSLPSVIGAQANAGAPYGARDPITCDSTKSKGSLPTAAEATRFFACANERESARWGLTLVEDVKLQTAGPRRYNPGNDLNVHQIDTSAPMLDLRGSFTTYQCDKVGGPGTGLAPAGRNCNKFSYLHATGTCYKPTFGDWSCQMMDMTVGDPGQVEVRGVAPPK
jgi:hypothetical protein